MSQPQNNGRLLSSSALDDVTSAQFMTQLFHSMTSSSSWRRHGSTPSGRGILWLFNFPNVISRLKFECTWPYWSLLWIA
jgi:hypothetical protein